MLNIFLLLKFRSHQMLLLRFLANLVRECRAPWLIYVAVTLALVACDSDTTPNRSGEDMSPPDAGPMAGEGGEQRPEDQGPSEDMGGGEVAGEEVDLDPPEMDPDLAPPPLRPLTINSLVPNRGGIAGGDRLQVIGTGFVEGMTITIDRIFCQDVVVETSSRARCTTPEGSVTEPVDVVLFAERLEMGELVPSMATLEGGFTYYVPLEIQQVSPTRGPTSGGTRVNVAGQGLTEETIVQFGGVRSPEVTLEPNGSLNVIAPPMSPGAVELRVQNINGDARIPEGFFYFERLEVDSLTPPIGPTSGGTSILVRGRGLAPRSRVTLGARPAETGEANGAELSFTTPSADAPGAVSLMIENDNGTLEVADAFVYYDEAVTSFEVAGISPTSGPLQGGQTLYVAGAGFTDQTVVKVDGRDASCERLSAHQLQCVTPPGNLGLVPVDVQEGANTTRVEGGYVYYEALELTSIFPTRGSVAGGTLVELTGRGFTAGMEVRLGDQLLTELTVLSEVSATGVTSPSVVSTVDVIASTPYTQGVIEGGYQFFDPTSQYGGVWGDGLDVSMNVTVLNGGSFEPEPDVYLLLITDELLTLESMTNEAGLATLSHPALRGLGTLTAAKEGFEVTTIERVGVENVTIILTPHPEGDGEPPPGVPPSILRGTVRGLDLIPKPRDLSMLNVAFVETTHTQPSNKMDLPPFGPGGILYEDGPFEITARLGPMAIVVTAGVISRASLDSYLNDEIDYWTLRSMLFEEVMGVRRYVSGRSGEVTEGLHVELDHPLDFEFPVDFDNPPYDPASGLEYYAVLPRLSFGVDGFWELPDTFVELSPNLELDSMVRLDGWGEDAQYFLINFAFSGTSANNTPLSVNILETPIDEDGVWVTPFAPAAVLETPLDGDSLGADRVIRWRLTEGYDGPATAHDAVVIEVSEPALGPPTPLWRYVVPTGVTEVEVPVLSSLVGGAGLGGGVMYLDIFPFIASGRFDYDDFTYLDINGARWASYGISSSIFTP